MSKVFRSKLEQDVAKHLSRYKDCRWSFEPFKLTYYKRSNLGFCGHCKSRDEIYTRHEYTPDFLCESEIPYSNLVILEVKGRFTAADRKKMLCVRECNDIFDFVLVFQTDNKLSKRPSAKRYSYWCKINKFPYIFYRDLINYSNFSDMKAKAQSGL